MMFKFLFLLAGSDMLRGSHKILIKFKILGDTLWSGRITSVLVCCDKCKLSKNGQ